MTTNAKSMSIGERARLAWDVMTHRPPRVPTRSEKDFRFAWPAWREGQPQWQIIDYANYVAEGFNANALIYSACMYKVRSSVLAPMRAYKGEFDHPELLPITHPLYRLCYRPNPYMTQSQFQSVATCYLNVAGNCYVLLDRPNTKQLPERMYLLRPDRVFIIPTDDKKGIIGYVHVPEGKSVMDGDPILPQDIIHVKLPNPGDPLEGLGYGLSPLAAQARSVDVDNSVTKFLKVFFDKGAMPNVYLSFTNPVDEGVMPRIRKRFTEIYGGWGNWTEPAILDNGGEIKTAGFSFKEMGFGDLDERNEARILGPLGVPVTLIGSRIGVRAMTQNNKELDRRMFWEDTMLPEITLFESGFRDALSPDIEDDTFVAFDTTKVPALRKDVPAQVTAFRDLVATGVTPNKAAEITGLDIGEIPNGDTSFMPLNLVAQRTAEEPSQNAMSPTQIDAALSVITQVRGGQLDYEAGLNALQVLFGLSLEQAKQLLGDEASIKPPEPEVVTVEVDEEGNPTKPVPTPPVPPRAGGEESAEAIFNRMVKAIREKNVTR